jgi:hypothetical protein
VAYADKFLNHYKLCRARQEITNPLRNIVWITTHLRPYIGIHMGEKHEDIIAYNKGMISFFQSNQCGENVTIVDVIQMTRMLQLEELRVYLKKQTFDGSHFKRNINVLKAQLILNSLVSSS